MSTELVFSKKVDSYYYQVRVDSMQGKNLKSAIWHWEIKIAIDDLNRYYGMAVERKHDVMVPWRKLKNKE
ncbi:hypothetical protein, partial [Bacillus cereus]|uniref:hypothetical protein n=1 Tax=Bacillus cereus TaxID=1396 RepID=UPI000BFAFC24